MSDTQPDKVIRISKDEALSGHVEDMLKRQMSMRGDPGVTRERRRNWFYQNWFVFGIVGMLGAILAWAIIEPHFHDMPYIQGRIDSLAQMDGGAADNDTADEDSDTLMHSMTGITINDEKILITSRTKEIKSNGAYAKLGKTPLEQGETIGVYTQAFRGQDPCGEHGQVRCALPAGPISRSRQTLTRSTRISPGCNRVAGLSARRGNDRAVYRLRGWICLTYSATRTVMRRGRLGCRICWRIHQQHHREYCLYAVDATGGQPKPSRRGPDFRRLRHPVGWSLDGLVPRRHGDGIGAGDFAALQTIVNLRISRRCGRRIVRRHYF